MARKVPFFSSYRTVGTIGTWAEYTLWAAVITAILNLLIDLCIISNAQAGLQKFLSRSSGFLALAYFFADILTNYLFQCAEAHRRNDLFDNSLNTVLAEENTEEYFTNDAIATGIYKLGVNGFENAFFTSSLAGRYLITMTWKTALVVLIFIGVMVYGDNSTLLVVLQLALPLTIIQQTIRLLIFKNRLDRIIDSYKRIFHIPKGTAQDNLIMHTVTNYEATLAWASIKIPDEQFNRMNDELSDRWEEIKKRHNIQ